MDHAHQTVIVCCQSNSAGAFDVNGAIGLCGCLGENADQVDDGIRSCDRSSDAHIVKYIPLDYLRCDGWFTGMVIQLSLARFFIYSLLLVQVVQGEDWPSTLKAAAVLAVPAVKGG